MSEGARNQPDDAVFETCRRILREHDVSTALVFGSAADPEREEWHDLDLVVEFATDRPGDDGYSATYLGLLAALDDALDADVDLVDVHSASPSFVAVALENGRLLVGSEERRQELLDTLGTDPPTIEDADGESLTRRVDCARARMADEKLRPEDATRIADAVESIERTVARLRSVQSLTREEYGAQENVETREAVERRFETLTAAVIDIAETVCRVELGRIPDSRKETITALETKGVLDGDLARRLREAVGFRDVLAHAYGPIVNDDIVYDAFQNSLHRYVEFVEAIRRYLETA